MTATDSGKELENSGAISGSVSVDHISAMTTLMTADSKDDAAADSKDDAEDHNSIIEFQWYPKLDITLRQTA